MADFLYLDAEARRRLKVLGGVLVFGLVVAAVGLCGKSPQQPANSNKKPQQGGAKP